MTLLIAFEIFLLIIIVWGVIIGLGIIGAIIWDLHAENFVRWMERIEDKISARRSR